MSGDRWNRKPTMTRRATQPTTRLSDITKPSFNHRQAWKVAKPAARRPVRGPSRERPAQPTAATPAAPTNAPTSWCAVAPVRPRAEKRPRTTTHSGG